MRTLIYTFADGTQTTSYAQAQASGKAYTVSLVPVAEKVNKPSPKKLEWLRKKYIF